MYMYKVIRIPINWISTELKVSKGNHKNAMGLYYMYFCILTIIWNASNGTHNYNCDKPLYLPISM